MHLAGYCFVGSLAVVIVGAVELWMVHRLKVGYLTKIHADTKG